MKRVGEVGSEGRGGVKLMLTTIPAPPPEKTTLKKPTLIRVKINRSHLTVDIIKMKQYLKLISDMTMTYETATVYLGNISNDANTTFL